MNEKMASTVPIPIGDFETEVTGITGLAILYTAYLSATIRDLQAH